MSKRKAQHITKKHRRNQHTQKETHAAHKETFINKHK